MLGWRGFTNPRPKIAKFKKLRSSLCVLYRRMKENWKQLQFSARLEFDDQESSLITRLLGLLKHYWCFQNIGRFLITITIFTQIFWCKKQSCARRYSSRLIRPVRHEIWTKLVGWKHEAITEIMFLGTMFLVRPVRHEIWTKLVGWKHEAITLLGNNLQTVFVECSFLENRIHDHIFF